MLLESINLSNVGLEVVRLINKENKQPICFSIVDESGELVYLHRINNAPHRLTNISISKAYTSVRMGVSTSEFKKRLIKDNLSVIDFMDNKLTPLPGGIPLFYNDRLIAGIGVSGRTLEEDVTLCEEIINIIINST